MTSCPQCGTEGQPARASFCFPCGVMAELTRACIARARGDEVEPLAGLHERCEGDPTLEAYLAGLRARLGAGRDPGAVRLNAMEIVSELEAWDAVQELIDVVGQHGDNFTVGLKAAGSWAEALLADVQGADPTEVENRFRAALAHAGHWKAVPAQARIHADFAVWLAGRSRGEEAALHVEAATETFTRLRAVAWQQQLESALPGVRV